MDRLGDDDDARPTVRLTFEGSTIEARAGEPIATALLVAGRRTIARSVKYHRRRAPFCYSGHCGSCLVRVDGRPNLRACQIPAREGQRVEPQNVFPSVEVDLLAATDFFFPRHMDHHTMFTHPRILNEAVERVVHRLAGLGTLPDFPIDNNDAAPFPAPRARSVGALVVGAGPAGLAAARALAEGGVETLVVEEAAEAGGSLLETPGAGRPAARAAREAAERAGAQVMTRATAIAWYGEDAIAEGAAPGLHAIHEETGAPGAAGQLHLVAAERVVYATGGAPRNVVVPGNDLPGVMAARAVGRLLVRDHVLPGRRVALVEGDGADPSELARALEAAGAEVTRLDARHVAGFRGRTWVAAVDLLRDGKRSRVRCDLVAVALPPAPSSELAREQGCAVRFAREAGGFAVTVDERGATTIPGVFACGDLTGARGPVAAAAHGALVGAHARNIA
jgi:sarcosine oxidase subunit alpha